MYWKLCTINIVQYIVSLYVFIAQPSMQFFAKTNYQRIFHTRVDFRQEHDLNGGRAVTRGRLGGREETILIAMK